MRDLTSAHVKNAAINGIAHQSKMKNKEFYTVRELAKKFDRTEYTIRFWLRTGVIKGKRLGKHWYIPKSSVEKIFKGE